MTTSSCSRLTPILVDNLDAESRDLYSLCPTVAQENPPRSGSLTASSFVAAGVVLPERSFLGPRSLPRTMKVDFNGSFRLQVISNAVSNTSSSSVVVEGVYSHMLLFSTTTTRLRRKGHHLYPEFGARL